jgi:hypothetical protein
VHPVVLTGCVCRQQGFDANVGAGKREALVAEHMVEGVLAEHLVQGTEESAVVAGPCEPIVAVRGAEAIVGSEGLVEREPHGLDEEITVADVADHFE